MYKKVAAFVAALAVASGIAVAVAPASSAAIVGPCERGVHCFWEHANWGGAGVKSGSNGAYGELKYLYQPVSGWIWHDEISSVHNSFRSTSVAYFEDELGYGRKFIYGPTGAHYNLQLANVGLSGSEVWNDRIDSIYPQ